MNHNDISHLEVNKKEIGRRNNDDLLKKKCFSWSLSKSQILNIFMKSSIISGHEMHYLYNYYPCEMVGEIIIKNIKFRFYMNAGSFISCENKDTTLYLGCQDRVFFLDGRLKKEDI